MKGLDASLSPLWKKLDFGEELPLEAARELRWPEAYTATPLHGGGGVVLPVVDFLSVAGDCCLAGEVVVVVEEVEDVGSSSSTEAMMVSASLSLYLRANRRLLLAERTSCSLSLSSSSATAEAWRLLLFETAFCEGDDRCCFRVLSGVADLVLVLICAAGRNAAPVEQGSF